MKNQISSLVDEHQNHGHGSHDGDHDDHHHGDEHSQCVRQCDTEWLVDLDHGEAQPVRNHIDYRFGFWLT